MKRIKVDFSHFKSLELAEKASFVIESMTGNVNFTTPSPTLAAMLTETNGLFTAITKAEQGTRAQKKDRDDKTIALAVSLTQLAGYVTSVAGSNETAMLSSGFDLERAKTPIGPLGQVENVRIRTTGVTGEVDIRCKKLRGAYVYEVQMTLTPDVEASWLPAATVTKARVLKIGLPSLKVHYFRIAGIGTSGQGPWSEVADGFAK